MVGHVERGAARKTRLPGEMVAQAREVVEEAGLLAGGDDLSGQARIRDRHPAGGA
jgi:hypothetical protein